MWRKVWVVLVTAGVVWAAKPVEKGQILPHQMLLTQPKVHNTVTFTRHRPTQSAPVIYQRDTLAFWDFEDGAQGWYAVDANSDGVTWTVGTTGDIHSYTPPNYGTQYAYYSDDDAGSGVGGEDYWFSSDTLYTDTLSSLIWSFGYGFETYQATDTLFAMVNFKQASGWSGWYIVWMKYGSTDENGTVTLDLGSYLPAESTIVAYGYWDRNPGGWNWAVAVDNVALTTTPPEIWDEAITGVSHPPTITAGVAWVDTVFLENQGNQDNTFDLYYAIYDSLGNFVISYSFPNFNHPASVTDTFAIFSISGLNEGFYTISIYHNLSGDNNTSNDTFNTYVLALDNHNYNNMKQVLICDLDPALFNTSVTGGGYAGQSGVHLALMLDDLGYVVDWVWGAIPSFDPYSVVFITHGVYGTLWGLPSALVTQMESYLQGGHKAYCEGGDIWGYGGVWENGSSDLGKWDTLFGIASASDGSSDLSYIDGKPSTLVPGVDGHVWRNDGENNYMDQLSLLTSYNGTLEGFLQNDSISTPYVCGVAYNNTDYGYYTVATDFELAFANQLVRGDPILVRDIVKDGLKEDPTAVAEASLPERPVVGLRVNGLSRNRATLQFSLPAAAEVSVDLYNLAGQKVRTLAHGTYTAGTHTLTASLDHLTSGVYFVVLKAGDLRLSRSLVLLR